MKSRFYYITGLIAACLSAPALAQTPAAAPQTGAGQSVAQQDPGDTIVVTGTREANRTVFESLAPVDVLNEEAIQDSASSEIGDALAILTDSQVRQLDAGRMIPGAGLGRIESLVDIFRGGGGIGERKGAGVAFGHLAGDILR